ncbi:collagen alpha-1(XIV) chain-like isoform X2 [Mya arenaria]|uniref:collagen alpha-1(XIV) chain-like isoform X2 n=1 Tax=Mya arenaria TaxID=6604 RepID=UPI0022E6FBFB|nr:collagen alpha-1(XIV) chain-like isoform X2 [Mya arenaria]
MGPTSGSAHKPYLGSDENCLTRKKEKDSEIHGRQDRGVSIDCCDTDLCNMPVTMTTTTTTTTENPTLAPTPRTTHRPAPVSIHPTMGHIPTTSIYSNCNRDVAFLVDSSGSVGSANFNTALGFIKGVVAGLPIGPMGTLTSLMTFSTTPNINWYFNQLTSKQETTNALASVSYHSGGTRTDLALHSASTQLFTPEHGDRTHANNVVIVLTDGKSNMPSETVKQANALHIISHDVITVFVGTGPDMHELQTIATDQHHVFTVHDFHLLSSLQYQIHQLICSG